MGNPNSPTGSPSILSYAAPPYRPGELKFWANGELLDMRENAVLPERCIKCNQPATRCAVHVNLSWIDPKVRRPYAGFRWIPYLRVIWILSTANHERLNR